MSGPIGPIGGERLGEENDKEGEGVREEKDREEEEKEKGKGEEGSEKVEKERDKDVRHLPAGWRGSSVGRLFLQPYIPLAPFSSQVPSAPSAPNVDVDALFGMHPFPAPFPPLPPATPPPPRPRASGRETAEATGRRSCCCFILTNPLSLFNPSPSPSPPPPIYPFVCVVCVCVCVCVFASSTRQPSSDSDCGRRRMLGSRGTGKTRLSTTS